MNNNNVFDNIIETAKDVYGVASKKTGELVEISKIKLECVKINGEIKKLYERLGNTVYSMMKANYENQSLVDSLVEEITENLNKLAELNTKLSDIKNINICPACNAKNPEDNYYCAKCGSRLKTEFSDEPYPMDEDETM